MRADEARLLVEKSKGNLPPTEDKVVRNIMGQVNICSIHRIRKFTKNLGFFVDPDIKENIWMYGTINYFAFKVISILENLGYEVKLESNGEDFPEITVGW